MQMTLPDGATFQFDNYYLSPETYESVFKEVVSLTPNLGRFWCMAC